MTDNPRPGSVTADAGGPAGLARRLRSRPRPGRRRSAGRVRPQRSCGHRAPQPGRRSGAAADHAGDGVQSAVRPVQGARWVCGGTGVLRSGGCCPGVRGRRRGQGSLAGMRGKSESAPVRERGCGRPPDVPQRPRACRGTGRSRAAPGAAAAQGSGGGRRSRRGTTAVARASCNPIGTEHPHDPRVRALPPPPAAGARRRSGRADRPGSTAGRRAQLRAGSGSDDVRQPPRGRPGPPRRAAPPAARRARSAWPPGFRLR